MHINIYNPSYVHYPAIYNKNIIASRCSKHPPWKINSFDRFNFNSFI